MRRLTLFAKGNVDVHDALHSCRIGGAVLWNGINDIVRQRYPDTLVRVKHETWNRSDALLAADARVPEELLRRDPPLGPYSAASQFSTALFDSTADAIILSIQPDVLTRLVRHRETGYLLYPNGAARWAEADRHWLRTEFAEVAPLDAATAMANFARIIERCRAHAAAPILVFNLSAIVPGETTHCYQGLGETFATRARRFNLALTDLSAATGVSIIDVDALVARGGADRMKQDSLHLTADGYRLVAAEVVRVLDDLSFFD